MPTHKLMAENDCSMTPRRLPTSLVAENDCS